MTTLLGQGVSGGCAIGRIALVRHGKISRAEAVGENRELALSRFAKARERAAAELDAIRERAEASLGRENAEIFGVHRMMLDDRDYLDAVESEIREKGASAEAAVSAASERFAAVFSAMDDEYMQARAADMRDIEGRLLLCLSGESTPSMPTEACILCADDLSPSETVALDPSRVLAFVTASGSASSHTAILAKSLGIPAIVGVGEALFSVVEGGLAIVDGDVGRLVLDPDEALLRDAEEKQSENKRRMESLFRLRDERSESLDGRLIGLYANVGSIEGVKQALANGAEGIGLFRSEMLYLGREDYPSEEEQYSVYRQTLTEMGKRRTVVRTLDVGADKAAPYLALPKEENPALGLRAIRFCLARPEILKTQLRALYRASSFGKLAIMFPMITSEWELCEVLSLCDGVRRELLQEGVTISDEVELGIMIETPAAAIISEKLAPLVDFFSVGTNDLIQYTLACDRGNETVSRYCDPHHAAVLELIGRAAKSAHSAGKWIGICGELAADTALTETFFEMEIDELSVSPSMILPLRERVRSLDLSDKIAPPTKTAGRLNE